MQAAATPLDSGPPQIEAAPRSGAAHILVLILAIIETLSALTKAPILFGDLPMLIGVLGVVAFGIGVAIHGF